MNIHHQKTNSEEPRGQYLTSPPWVAPALRCGYSSGDIFELLPVKRRIYRRQKSIYCTVNTHRSI